MILGTGVDIIEIARMTAALSNPRTGERFRRRVFTANEIAYCERRRRSADHSFAARWAAKEATMKALGRLFGWQEIEVLRHNGPPTIAVYGRAAKRAADMGIRKFHLSVSHDAGLAVAYVIAEGDASPTSSGGTGQDLSSAQL